MIRFDQCFMTCALIATGLTLPAIPTADAQDAGVNATLEEIVVTGRKREESMTDVPVAITVMNQDFIREAGIFNTQDMFDAAVGFEYDSGWGSRNTSKPGVRGVQGNGLGVTQQKMNSFMDGFPLVGQQGSIPFNDVAAVELYRGPQSAAFGRATFAGAVNYVSRNPTDEFESRFTVGTSDLGRQEIQLALGGPITETLGYTLDISSDSFVGPDEWKSDDGGYQMSSWSTDYLSTKLVWEPTDNFAGKFRYIHHRADDMQGNQLYIDQTELQSCSNTTIGRANNPHLYFSGEVTAACNFEIPSTGIPRSFDLTAGAGLSPGDQNYDLYFAFSNFDPYARDERDRYHLELDFGVGDGIIQVLGMYSEEYFEAWRDGDNTNFVPAPAMTAPNLHDGGATRLNPGSTHRSNPYNLTERYLEVRYVSPEENRLRWIVGASKYTALSPGIGSVETAGHRLAAENYGVAIRSWINSSGNTVVGREFRATSVYGDRIFNEAIYGSVNYDISDRTEFSAEARLQSDKIENNYVLGNNELLANSTDSFQPRISITHDLNGSLSVYGQLARGTNPAGVNIGYMDEDVIKTIGLANAAGHVTYEFDTFRTFVEEELTNFEVGLKGTAFDDRLSFTAAIYALQWDNQTNIYSVNWNDTDPGGWNEEGLYSGSQVGQRTTLNEGSIANQGVEFEGTYFLTGSWSLNGNFTVMASEFTDYCDVLAAGGAWQLPTDGTAPLTGVACVTQDGNTPPHISATTYSIGIAYRAPVGGGWNLAGRTDLRHTGPQWMDTSNILKIGERNLVNGSLTLSNESWTARLYANNLLDDDLPRQVVGGTNHASPGRARGLLWTPTRPREFGMALSYRF